MQMKGKSERGQATLEFLVIAPLLFGMVFLIAYAGWYSYAKLSAQNAAYGWAIFNPTQKPTIAAAGRFAAEAVEYPGGNFSSMDETLHSSLGMKEMWGETVHYLAAHPTIGNDRLGGAYVTVWVFPGEIEAYKYYEVWNGVAEDKVPKGTAFFHFAPLISVRP
jgi:hypothetical protein